MAWSILDVKASWRKMASFGANSERLGGLCRFYAGSWLKWARAAENKGERWHGAGRSGGLVL